MRRRIDNDGGLGWERGIAGTPAGWEGTRR